jgi:putative salt-induced outer membrane protein YdiY
MIYRQASRGGALCGALGVFFATGSALAANGGQVAVAQGMAKDGPGFKGQLSVDIGVTTGNTEMVQSKAAAVATYERGPHNVLGAITAAYAESKRTAVGEQVIVNTHYRYRLFEHLAAEVYANYAYDKFAGFDVQLAMGPDLVLLFQIDALRIDIGLGYMIQYEDYGAITGPAAGDSDTAHRAQLYLFTEYDLAPNLQFIEHAFYMPRFDGVGPKDYMFISATSLSIQLNPILSFQNTFNLAYDVPAPLNTKRLNTQLLVGLAVNF